MNHFQYQNQELFAENVAISQIAKKVGTPFYCYSQSALVQNYQAFESAFVGQDHKICYAIKANSNINLVKILAQMGSGIDAVSQGEIFRALKAGIDPKKIVFAGVGKTKQEFEYALKNGVEEFSVESEPELFLLSKVAQNLGLIAKIALRVNPNVDAKTHEKISTGKKGDKFGIDIENAKEIYCKAKNLPNIKIFGIATHIGSQITSLEPFKIAFLKIRELCLELQQEGFDIKNLDFGGGIGISYDNEELICLKEYAKLIKEVTKDLNVSITIAPGRSIVGNAGIMVSEIIYLKKTNHKNFLIIDAAMNDLARPGLYDSYHKVIPINQKEGNKVNLDIVGPICETTDVLAKNRFLTAPEAGEIVAFLASGAYGSTMSNEYNSRPLIPEILVCKASFKMIRKRPSYEQMVALEEF